MITQETAARIWNCYREIETGKKLLEDMTKAEKDNENDDSSYEPSLTDVFGRRRQLELGVPSGHNSHRIFQVAPELAKSVIRSHIANKEAELVEANEQARIELMGTE